MIVSESDAATVDRRFRALADPTRRDVLARTMGREHSVTELAEAYTISFAAVQRHIAVLEEAGLVTKRPVHRHRYVRARPEAVIDLAAALRDLAALWSDRVERMHDVLDDDNEEAADGPRHDPA